MPAAASYVWSFIHLRKPKRATTLKAQTLIGAGGYIYTGDRYGGNLMFYFMAWLQSSTDRSFFEWLDHGDGLQLDLEVLPREKLESHTVKYCGFVDRRRLEVVVIDGKLTYREVRRGRRRRPAQRTHSEKREQRAVTVVPRQRTAGTEK